MSEQPTQKKKEQISLSSAIVANIFLPGLGSWQLGSKKRGLAIILIMVFSVLMAGYSYASALSNQLDAALDIADDAAFEESFSSSGSFIWLGLAALTFIYSFIDLYLLFRRQLIDFPGAR